MILVELLNNEYGTDDENIVLEKVNEFQYLEATLSIRIFFLSCPKVKDALKLNFPFPCLGHIYGCVCCSNDIFVGTYHWIPRIYQYVYWRLFLPAFTVCWSLKLSFVLATPVINRFKVFHVAHFSVLSDGTTNLSYQLALIVMTINIENLFRPKKTCYQNYVPDENAIYSALRNMSKRDRSKKSKGWKNIIYFKYVWKIKMLKKYVKTRYYMTIKPMLDNECEA